jgi:hypothetical protein
MKKDVDEFVEGAARAYWVTAWADHMEEQGESLGSGDLMDLAPPTPLSAYVAAGELIGSLTCANKVHWAVLAARAAEADGYDYDPTEIDLEEFGHYLAMQSMGHGVSWFDDHAEFDIKIPHVEYHYEG